MKARFGLLVLLTAMTLFPAHSVLAESNKYNRCLNACKEGVKNCLRRCETKKEQGKAYAICKNKACKLFKEYCHKNCKKRYGG